MSNFEPVLHKSAAERLDSLLQSKPHAIGLIGPFGAGKSFLANWLSKKLLGQAYKTGAVYKLLPAKGSIGVDEIREIQKFTKLKTTGKAVIRRVVVIDDAHSLTLEAQNALLKSLEEPPEDTCFILSIAGEKSLLPTVLSRLQKITIPPVSWSDFEKSFIGDFSESDIRRAYAVSGGYMGLGYALLNNSDDNLNQAIADAKQLLGQAPYERLLMVDELAKDKPRLQVLLYALKRVLSTAAHQSSAKNDRATTSRLVQGLQTVIAAESAVGKNPNMKLLLSHVFLNL